LSRSHANTSYKVVDAQIEVPPTAAARKGIVTFTATIETPPGTGTVVAVEWNFDGAASYAAAALGERRPAVSVKATHT
jgi:hypothetical protein